MRSGRMKILRLIFITFNINEIRAKRLSLSIITHNQIFMEIETIITSIFGCSTLIGWLLYGRETKRAKNAEIRKSEWQIEAERLKELRETNHELNGTISDQAQRISQLTDDLLNESKHRISDAQEIGRLRTMNAFLQQWQCEREQDETPDGCMRRKPRQKVALKYIKPDSLQA